MSNVSKFWKWQPVGMLSSKKDKWGQVTALATDNHTPTPLPSDEYKWECVFNKEQVQQLLDTDYASDGNVHLVYPKDFALYYLNQTQKSWWCAIVHNETYIGFVAAAQRQVVFNKVQKTVAEVNLLIVHPKYRNKSLAPLLIKEITRKITNDNVTIALYTTGKGIPQEPFTEIKYHHILLDFKRAQDVGFTNAPSDKEVFIRARFEHHYREEETNGLITVPYDHSLHKEGVLKLFKTDTKRLDIYETMTTQRLKEQSHETSPLLCRVALNPIGKVVAYFCVMPYTAVITQKDGTKDELPIAQMYHMAGNVFPAIKGLLTELQKKGFAVLNVTDNASTKGLLQDINALPGSAKLYMYAYNYKIPHLKAKNVYYQII